jgi:hypothetical protein
MFTSNLIRIVLTPPNYFEVIEWGAADAFDDFLSEVVGIEFSTEFVENDGKFVSQRFFPLVSIPINEMQRIADSFNRHILRLDLKQIVATSRFVINDAKQLLGYDWRPLTSDLPTAVRQEAEELYLQIMESVEKVEEGRVDDLNTPDILKRIEEFLKHLPGSP